MSDLNLGLSYCDTYPVNLDVLTIDPLGGRTREETDDRRNVIRLC